MAEWLSTDLFEHSVTAPSRSRHHANAGFGQVEAALANRAEHVKQSAEKEKRNEGYSEQQFGSNQFLHKIQLQNEKNYSRCDDRDTES
jgi:hypothetical protein